MLTPHQIYWLYTRGGRGIQDVFHDKHGNAYVFMTGKDRNEHLVPIPTYPQEYS